MSDLRGLADAIGLGKPQTLLQSGNLVFESRIVDGPRLERRLEEAAQERFGLDIDFVLRAAEEWHAVIRGNPYPEHAERDPGHLLVQFLKSTPGRSAVTGLSEAISGRETAVVRGPHAYFFYPDGVGRSKLTTALIERTLGVRGTARNWNTVLKLGALARGG